jgi:hypothetical protein
MQKSGVEPESTPPDEHVPKSKSYPQPLLRIILRIKYLKILLLFFELFSMHNSLTQRKEEEIF